jgi:acyl-CoA dehydrogenase
MSAGVPKDLGGDGLDASELARLLTAMAHACSSTALAFAMHTHVVALLAWRRRHQNAPVDAVLKRVADEQLVLISTGGADWLASSGEARKAEGGFTIHARKGFASGVPAGALVNTSAIYDDPETGPTVLHFMAPLSSDKLRVEDNWRAMGMRGTASNAVQIDGFFVPDGAVALKRPQGRWHMLFHIISMVAIPLIYSVYLGVAEAARDAAVEAARKKRPTSQLVDLVGEMETELAAARLAAADMIAASAGSPGVETTNRVYLGRENFVRAAMACVGLALEVAGAAGFMRGQPVERLFRDIQGARFHPITTRPQRDFAGRVALGLELDGPIG